MHYTYMLLTAATVAISAVAVLVESTAGGLAGRVLLAVVAPLLVALNLVAVGELAYSIWIDAHRGNAHTRVLSALPWRALRVLDHYLALNVAWALLLLVFWAWDGSANRAHYFVIIGPASRQNVWAAWLTMLNTVFQIFLGVGYGQLIVAHPLAEAIALALNISSGILRPAVYAFWLSEAYEAAKQTRQHFQQQQPPYSTTIVDVMDPDRFDL